jgi:hypothetical protein
LLPLIVDVKLIAISSFKTLSSVFNVEMVKDKTAEEIKQVIGGNE